MAQVRASNLWRQSVNECGQPIRPPDKSRDASLLAWHSLTCTTDPNVLPLREELRLDYRSYHSKNASFVPSSTELALNPSSIYDAGRELANTRRVRRRQKLLATFPCRASEGLSGVTLRCSTMWLIWVTTRTKCVAADHSFLCSDGLRRVQTSPATRLLAAKRLRSCAWLLGRPAADGAASSTASDRCCIQFLFHLDGTHIDCRRPLR